MPNYTAIILVEFRSEPIHAGEEPDRAYYAIVKKYKEEMQKLLGPCSVDVHSMRKEET